jgi:hypothetical protein
MGALIRTMGTKLLIAHFNDEFSTYINFYRQAQNIQFFNAGGTSYTDLLHATNSITDTGDPIHAPRSDHLSLLPYLAVPARGAAGVQQHANLENRWKWFLTTANVSAGALTQANHDKIAAAIYTALSGTFDSITFDAVEVAGSQDVSAAVAYDEGSTKYMQIVLYTSAMPLGSPGSTNPYPIDSVPTTFP